MADTRFVIPQPDWRDTDTKLLGIVANLRGAQDAVEYGSGEIHRLSFFRF